MELCMNLRIFIIYEQGKQIETEHVNPWRIIILTILLPLALQNFYFFSFNTRF